VAFNDPFVFQLGVAQPTPVFSSHSVAMIGTQELLHALQGQMMIKTKLSNANNSKESWQAINELLNEKPKTTHVTQLNVDDQVITGDTNIADCFNQYFSSIGCKLSNNVQNINVFMYFSPGDF
jgi:hypothetical protein